MPAQTIEGFALSLQQKRCWSFLATTPETELVSRAQYTIHGELDSAVFEQALRRVIERHEILRSVFKTIPGIPEPAQVLEEEFELRASRSGRRLQHAPVIDWDLENCSGGEHLLRVSLPAISGDYTTLKLFLEEIAKAYEEILSGEESTDEPMQYLDYAQWQSDVQSSSEAGSGLQHWRNLEIEEPRTSMLLERPASGFKAECEWREIHSALWQEVERAANLSGTPVEVVVVTAWAAFCAGLKEAQSELILGINTSGRNFDELKSALGPYDRYLPVRIKNNENGSPAKAIQALRSAHTAALQYQDFYGSPVGGADRQLSLLFAARENTETVACGGLNFEFSKGESHSEPFSLKLELVCVKEGLPRLDFFYNAERFSEEYAGILADRFQAFLTEFVTKMDAPLRTLKTMCTQEINLVTERFRSSGVAEPATPSVIEAFRRAAEQHPQRPALICDGKILTYEELNARANRLANLLLKHGVAAGAPVAISAERSFEMIVGLLGIQKAGGAYVPLDPGYPKDRLQFVLEDCGAKVLVAQTRLIAKLPPHKGKTIELSEENAELRAQESSDPKVMLSGETLAYIIYTSGSTGQPKGVGITHRNLAYSTAARIQYYHEPLANYLLLSSFAFDSSIAGIFWCLAQGATLTIPREGTHNDPNKLVGMIREYKVSHLLALPSFYLAILEHGTAQDLNSLTTVIVAGEACTRELVNRHYKKSPRTALYNEYGPTEGTVWATVHRCERDARETNVPIGRPVPNMSVYILDEEKRPVGVGRLGEIHIGGPTVATGYLNRPELSAEKFVPNPLVTTEPRQPGPAPSILYRTGDLACFRADGTIEFHGRIDEQVKIRGYRIEIGEIENVLARHPDVREAVVLAREDTPGEKRLMAYLVPKDQAHFSIPDLRLFAQEKLPQFMVPAQFMTLKALPLTPNGKVDRKGLPAPEEFGREDRKFLAPRNPDEEILARIWAEVLKLEKVGMEENFFDLGGHSLLAIQVIARVRDAFKLELPMASFFESPTIAGMAAALAQCRNGKRTSAGEIKRVARVQVNGELLAKLQNASGK